jgi:conjugal transfer ATP-binding protein TraC
MLNKLVNLLKVSATSEEELPASLPTQTANRLFERHSFSTYIRPTVCDDDNVWTTNDGEYGIVMEIAPRVGMGAKTSGAFEQLLGKMPNGILMQIILFGSKNIEALLARWKSEHAQRNTDLGLQAIDQFEEFFRHKTTKVIDNEYMKTMVKNARTFITVKSKSADKLREFAEQTYNILDANKFYPVRLSASELKPVFWEIANPNDDFRYIPSYMASSYFNRQCVSPNHKTRVFDDRFEINGKSWIALTPINYPDYALIGDFGAKLGDTFTEAMDINQFADTYIVTTNIRRVGASVVSKIATAQKLLSKKKTNKDDTLEHEKKQETYNNIKMINKKEPLFEFDLVVLVSGEDKATANRNASQIESFWAMETEELKSPIRLERMQYQHHIGFIGAAPLGANGEYFKITSNHPEAWPASNCVQFLPLESDWRGNSPNFLVLGRRGQIAGIDPSKTSASKNFYVIGRSGSGKSAMLNYITFCYYMRGARVFIFDIGGSYEPLCRELGGQYINVGLGTNLSFNPFSEIEIPDDLETIAKQWRELEESIESNVQIENRYGGFLGDVDFLSDFLYMLGASLNIQRSLEDEKFIKNYLKDTLIKLYATHENDLEITIIRDFIAAEQATRDKRLSDFAVSIGQYCRGGTYGQFFSGKSQVDFKADFVVSEFGQIELIADIRDALISVMNYHVSRRVYQSKDSVETLVLLDEAHRFLNHNPRMDSMVIQAYKRYRKHKAGMGIGTQGYDDLLDDQDILTPAGRAIIQNAPFKFIMQQEDPALNKLCSSNVFKISAYQEKILRSIETRKDHFSEFFCMTPSNDMIAYRTLLNPYFLKMISTDPDDKEKIAKTQERLGCSRREAIKYLVEEKR